ncbi:uncharacterized protein LOC110875837 [Helianthus annuus]|uniref:uncharacterized protein LOC110875837 n=1 Tax=Helianthus annuus TaxID=4232 RepID=UPI000B8F7C9E|nr:uncharacterized protein LOC110875837 [Helianthus annuus]
MEELSGLMRTTSRSESENHLFGQVCNSKATLVEFMTHYETAIEAQCHTHRRNDHESRYKRPQLKNCINQRYEDQPDGFVKFNINDFLQPCTSLFELYIVFDVFRSCTVSLIAHAVAYASVLSSLVSPNCSSEYSMSREYMTELDPDVQSMMREIVFATKYTLNRLSGNKEELSSYKDHVQSYMKKVQDMQIVAPPPSTRDRSAEITDQYRNNKNPIRVPVGYKSKGSGSRKRLKSKPEVAIEKMKSKSKPGAKERQCQNCKVYGH